MKNDDRWENYYNMYASKMKQTKKEIKELEEVLFGPAGIEPYVSTYNGFITGEEYYKFVSDMLKVANPLFDQLGEESVFKKAGMSWLYDYHIKTAPYRCLKELSSRQYKLLPDIEQVNAFIDNGKYPGDGQREKMYKEYTSLCNDYPDLYKMDIFPFEIDQ